VVCIFDTLNESNKKLRLNKRFLTGGPQKPKRLFMNKNISRWNKLFLFCLGLFIAGAFSMKWMEPDLVYNNENISIFGLELFYPREKIIEILSGINEKVKIILGYHLSFDFIFMAGCYPGIACLCMMAMAKTKQPGLTKFLFVLACMQLFAWTFDIIENFYLLKWLKQPVINNEFGFYHVVVYAKWIIALSAAFMALSILLINMLKKKPTKIVN